jgi:hypothetical protein
VEPALDYEAVIVQASGAVNDMVRRSIRGAANDHRLDGAGDVGQLLTNRSLYDELNGTLARTNALVTRLQAPNGSLGKLLDDPALYQNLNGMIGSVDSLVRQMRSQDGTLGRLLSDDTLYRHLVSITSGAVAREATDARQWLRREARERSAALRATNEDDHRSQRHSGRRTAESTEVHEGNDQGLLRLPETGNL